MGFEALDGFVLSLGRPIIAATWRGLATQLVAESRKRGSEHRKILPQKKASWQARRRTTPENFDVVPLTVKLLCACACFLHLAYEGCSQERLELMSQTVSLSG